MKNGFVNFLKEEKEKTDRDMRMMFEVQQKQSGQYGERFAGMVDLISSQVLRGGKRARPLLVRLAYGLAGGDKDKSIVRASLFIELIHANLLVHDDIIDRDLKRYGGDTLEVEFKNWYEKTFQEKDGHFGMSLALASGDHLRNLAHLCLHESDFEADKKNECELLAARVLTETVAGWQMQFWQNFDEIEESSEEKFLRGLELVTSRYTFEAPLMLGVILAGKRKKYEKVMKEYALNAGIAFQIQDDILGVFGDTDKTGKPVGNDLREGKKTLLVLRAFKNSSKTEKKFLKKIVGSDLTKEELVKARKLMVDSGSLQYSVDKAKAHVEKAKDALKGIDADNEEAVERLAQLADFVVSRSY